MSALDRLNPCLAAYVEHFPLHWEEEAYKWRAVQWFQDRWDLEAEDFGAMFAEATRKADNLVGSSQTYPRAGIRYLSERSADAVRAMFRQLYDESLDLTARIAQFNNEADKLIAVHDALKSYSQGYNAISVYLWLRYPDKYFIYKWTQYKTVVALLGGEKAKQRDISSCFQLYEAIAEKIRSDEQMNALLPAVLTADCWPDRARHTMAQDFAYFVAKYYQPASSPAEAGTVAGVVTGGETGSEVVSEAATVGDVVTDAATDVATDGAESDVAMDDAGAGDCEADSWFPDFFSPGLSANDFYALLHHPEVFNADALSIMRRMLDYGGEATCKELSNKYGRSANFYNNNGSAIARRVVAKTHCPRPERDTKDSQWWPVIYVGRYNKDKRRAGNYIWRLRDELREAVERFDFTGVRLYEDGMEPEGFVEPVAAPKLEDGREPEAVPDVEPVVHCEPYDKAHFLADVYMSEENYDNLSALLLRKLNVILQGAPGVGKTYAAKRLAYSLLGRKDDSCLEMVQFHQNYSYEDFVLGYRPDGEGFTLSEGVFYRFCRKAAQRPEEKHFFIIDEINRGNLSKIFGELLMLIERDYRGEEVRLAYGDKCFGVPANVYVIGLMNTADRSLAMMDYALRRRFSFFEMEPGFAVPSFRTYAHSLHSRQFLQLTAKIEELNRQIAADESLGRGFCVGHSYFCGASASVEQVSGGGEARLEGDAAIAAASGRPEARTTLCTSTWLRGIVDYDILPTLREYWFDNRETVKKWEDELHSVFTAEDRDAEAND